ncbi:MAG: tetratricopeptide repeat protein [bacterium]
MSRIDPERWQRADAIFQEAIDVPREAREAWLASACAGDAELLAAVRALLAADESGRGLLDGGVDGLAAALLPAAPAETGAHDTSEDARAGDDDIPDAPDPLVGRTLGRFRVLGRLGEGGMGIVYEAEQEDPKRRVALKVMRGGWAAGADGLRFFRREAQTLARLQHPGIAAIYEAGRTDDGQHFFAMELVRGVPLDAVFGAGAERGAAAAPGGAGAAKPAAGARRVTNSAEVRERLDLFLEVCDAIVYAHQRGVIHRDLKPSNILVSLDAVRGLAAAPRSGDPGSSTSSGRSPRVKVVDFGLARISDADVTLVVSQSEPRALQGTLPYMSPEQTHGRPDEIDFRSDVYSLGVILYRLLTGEAPYVVRADALLEAVRAIREEIPRRAGAIVPLLRGEVETILAKALEKEPDRRYQSVMALAEDLRRFLSDQPILARPASAAYHLRKLAARHRAASALLATLAVVLVGSSVALLLLYQSQRAATGKAEREARKAQRINEFLQGMLAGADPVRAQGREVTVEMMLDEATSRVDTSFVAEPDIAAELRRTLGVTYSALGRLPPAEEQLRRAIEARRALHGPRHAEVAKSLGDLASVLSTKGAYAEAERVSQEALAIVRETSPGDAEEARHLDLLALLAKRDTRYADSESLYIEALAIERSLPGPPNEMAATTLGGLASLYEIQGKLTLAESLYHEVAAIYRDVLGDAHPGVAVVTNNLAIVVDKLGRYAEAESLYSDAIARGRVLYKGPHPLLSSRIYNRGVTLRKLGRHDEAIASHREALQMRWEVYGEEQPAIARALGGLATALSAGSEHAEAESLGRAALAMSRRLHKPESDEIARAAFAFASILRRAGKPAEAIEHYRVALEGYHRIYGTEHRDVASVLQGLAEAESDLGRFAAAEPLFVESLRLRRALEGEDHPLVAGVLWSMATAKTQHGDSAACEPLMREALAIWEKKLPAEDERISDAALALSRVLVSIGRSADAESIIAKRYEIVSALPSSAEAGVEELRARLSELHARAR